MTRATYLLVATGLVALPALARSQEPDPGPSPASHPRRVEARAEEELRKMAELLAKTPRFRGRGRGDVHRDQRR
jgi:hypothetical protein